VRDSERPDVLRLRSEVLEVDVRPSSGAQFTHLALAGRTNVLAWYDWPNPLPAGRGPSYGDDRLDWLSAYRGGWQELFPNAGAACVVDGVPLPFHGECSMAEWEVVSHSDREAVLRCPARLPLMLERRIRLAADRPVLLIDERISNLSDLEVPYLWGHHPAFELPPGSRIDLSPDVRYQFAPEQPGGTGAKGAWPTSRDSHGRKDDLSEVPSVPTERVVFLSDADGWFGLRAPGGTGIACAWQPETFPYLWLWQHLAGPGFPTFGRGWITALEPVNVSNGEGLAAALALGEAPRLPPGGSAEAWITVSLFDSGERPVAGVERDGSIRFAPSTS